MILEPPRQQREGLPRVGELRHFHVWRRHRRIGSCGRTGPVGRRRAPMPGRIPGRRRGAGQRSWISSCPLPCRLGEPAQRSAIRCDFRTKHRPSTTGISPPLRPTMRALERVAKTKPGCQASARPHSIPPTGAKRLHDDGQARTARSRPDGHCRDGTRRHSDACNPIKHVAPSELRLYLNLILGERQTLGQAMMRRDADFRPPWRFCNATGQLLGIIPRRSAWQGRRRRGRSFPPAPSSPAGPPERSSRGATSARRRPRQASCRA